MNDFKQAYDKLNPRQKEAVDAIDGPVMVIAGPGTGKTQILSLRIANILQKTDTSPENILALTFTESGTANMRKRLVEMIGTPGYYVQISTFHGFANRLIQEYPDYYPTIIGGRNATDIDRIAIVRDILEDGDFEHLKPFGDKFFYVNDILGAIRDIKNEGLDPEAYAKLVRTRIKEFENRDDLHHEKGAHKGKMKLDHQKDLRNLEKNKEIGGIYEKYEAALKEARLYDFEDMILETIRSFEDKKDFLLEVQEKAQYILVDEHQDTNGAQNRILELLASFYESPNLFVVGDEKQAIFRFQGASIENFLYFKNKYENAKLINLEENYRSTQTILDSAQSLIEHNASTLHSPLKATKDYEEKKIQVVSADMPEAEYLFIVRRIEELMEDGVPAEEIAVLYRENREAETLAENFERFNIPFVIESDQNILADPDIQKLVKLLEAIDDLGNEERLAEALHIDFLGIQPLDIYKLLNGRTLRNYTSLYNLIGKEDVLKEMELEDRQALLSLYENLSKWKLRSKNEHFLKFFEEIVRESGYLNHLLKNPGYFEKVSKLNTLFGEIKKAVGNRGDYNLSDFIQYLSILKEHRVMIRNKVTYLPHAVRLMTAHKAKGLEFDYVFIYGACDGRWGNRRNMGKISLPFRRSVDISELEKNEDERRLFYMALTRARKMAWITTSTHSADGKEQVPSQFITEIKEELKQKVHAKAEEEEFLAKKEMLFSPRTVTAPRLDDKEFLRELFKRRGFSVTALNNYLACPWKYFYVNLLRLPESMSVHQVYGTAVHAALQRFFNAKKEGEDVGKEFLVERFTTEIGRHPLWPDDAKVLLNKGRQVLEAYHDNYKDSWNYNVLNEYKIDGVTLSEDIVLNGKLDKIELLDTPGDISVVDYKVKQPMSRNAIEGNTQSSNGDYKRQLIFYKLLIDGSPEKKLKMRSGVIDFVEPNDRGIFKQEVFEITNEEVAELKELILKTGQEILDLSFWDKTCGEKDCEYCALRAMLV
jgi:DNA helicase-2/ATP-dependent DNA helicase PcrA